MAGKGILLLMLGFAGLTTLLTMNLNTNVSQGLEETVNFYDQTQARLIANSGVEIFLEQLRRNKTLKGSFKNNSLLGGNFDLSITGVDSLMTITADATFKGITHRSIVTARRSGITIPDIYGSLYVSAQNLNVNLKGNVEINGNDHDINGNPVAGPSVPGIAVDNPADSAYIINEIKPKVSKNILGLGGDPSVHTVNSATNWEDVTANYIFAADTTLPSGNYATGTVLGTTANPKITYVNGDVHFTGQAEGAGIMVVNGNITLSGQFTFRGILIGYGQSTIETKTVGNSGVYGAVILVGDNVEIDASAGNSKMFYSSQSINLAKNNLKSTRFEILSWWE